MKQVQGTHGNLKLHHKANFVAQIFSQIKRIDDNGTLLQLLSSSQFVRLLPLPNITFNFIKCTLSLLSSMKI